MDTETFTAKVDAWLKTQDHIGDEHPTAFGLRAAAAELDIEFRVTLLTEYNKTIRYIESLKPQEIETATVDPLLFPDVALETRGA